MFPHKYPTLHVENGHPTFSERWIIYLFTGEALTDDLGILVDHQVLVGRLITTLVRIGATSN